MRLHRILIVAGAAAAACNAANAATAEIRDAAARVTVIPEARSDIKVEMLSTNPKLPLRVQVSEDRTIIDGDLERRIRNCRGGEGAASVTVRGVGDIRGEDLPQVVIRTPASATIQAGGAVFGSVGRSQELHLANAGCGDWTVANVEGAARISQAGSGDTRMGSSGGLRVKIAGSGDVVAGEVRGGADIDIAGSGAVSIKAVDGPLEIGIAGSGDVVIAGGKASAMKVSVAGSGNVEFRGVADTLAARITGSGDVSAHQVKGEISKTVIGSGSIHVGS